MTKSEKLNLIAEKISQCQKCPELANCRTQTVPGNGNAEAHIVFCGEAPGMTEDQKGVPFCGKSGTLLTNILAACELSREKNVFITNICKCRPPGNRTPTTDESLILAYLAMTLIGEFAPLMGNLTYSGGGIGATIFGLVQDWILPLALIGLLIYVVLTFVGRKK